METRGLFDEIVNLKRDVSETYLVHGDGILPDVLDSLGQIHQASKTVRAHIEGLPYYPHTPIDFTQHRGPVLIDMPAVARLCQVAREDLYAIDGTPATPHLRYSSIQLFAVAVMGMSYATLDTPETTLARTKTEFLEKNENLTDWDALVQWMTDQDVAETNQSWPTTFREYVEREYAIKKHKAFTLLDGPVLTQNLITQARGRALLTDLARQPFQTCGVIKSIKSSTNAHRILAQALLPGEALLVESSHDLVSRRNIHAKNEAWVGVFFEGLRASGSDIWRGVYRPTTRAFGFECDLKHVDTTIAMLWHERDISHLGHEIPFLLNQVDAHLRATYNAGSFKRHLTYQLGLELGEDELLDEIDERDMR